MLLKIVTQKSILGDEFKIFQKLQLHTIAIATIFFQYSRYFLYKVIR